MMREAIMSLNQWQLSLEVMMREAIMSLNQWQLSLEVVDAAAIIRVAVGHAELPKLVHVHAQRPR